MKLAQWSVHHGIFTVELALEAAAWSWRHAIRKVELARLSRHHGTGTMELSLWKWQCRAGSVGMGAYNYGCIVLDGV